MRAITKGVLKWFSLIYRAKCRYMAAVKFYENRIPYLTKSLNKKELCRYFQELYESNRVHLEASE
jgi:hypothetical protein